MSICGTRRKEIKIAVIDCGRKDFTPLFGVDWIKELKLSTTVTANQKRSLENFTHCSIQIQL